jgi:hypothetical protein
MKRARGFLAFVGPVALLTCIFAGPLQAVPIKLTIDNPHQTVVRPANGAIVLDFIGTVAIGDRFSFEEAILDVDYDHSSDDGIPTQLGSLNFSDADHGGSVSGVLFTALISSSTTPGLYGFHFGGSGPAEFSIEVSDERQFVTASQAFSIRVIASDASDTLLLSSIAISSLLLLRRHWTRNRTEIVIGIVTSA